MNRNAVLASLLGIGAAGALVPDDAEAISQRGFVQKILEAGGVPTKAEVNLYKDMGPKFWDYTDDLMKQRSEAAKLAWNFRKIPPSIYQDVDVNVQRMPEYIPGIPDINIRGRYFTNRNRIDLHQAWENSAGEIEESTIANAFSVGAHETGHHQTARLGMRDLEKAGLSYYTDLVDHMSKTLPANLMGAATSGKVRRSMVQGLSDFFDDPVQATTMMLDLGKATNTSLHTLGEVVAASVDAYTNDLLKNSQFKDRIYGFAKAFLGVSPVLVAALGVTLGMETPEAEAALRVHMAPKQIEKLVSLREAPLRQGTGGMREGAGLYTTEVGNTWVQKNYQDLFKNKSAVPPEIDSPAAAWTAHRMSPRPISTGYDLRAKAVASGIYDSLDHAERMVDAKAAAGQGITVDDMRLSFKRNVESAADDVRDALKEFRRVRSAYNSNSELFEDAGIYQHQSLYRAVGKYIGYKKMMTDPDLFVKPGSPGEVFKHTLETSRPDDDFLWRGKLLSEQPQILRKVADAWESISGKPLQPEYIQKLSTRTGADAYDGFVAHLSRTRNLPFEEAQIRASEIFHDVGIAGNRYLINGGKGPGFNEVLFAPQKDATILDVVKLGVPIAIATTAVMTAYDGMENNAEAFPKPLLKAGTKAAADVVSQNFPKTTETSRVLKEAWKYTFPEGPYKGKTIENIVRAPKKNALWYMIFDDGSVGRVEKEEAELLAKNLGIRRYMDRFENALPADKKVQAVGSAISRKEAWQGSDVPPATPLERLEKVHALGLPIQPYTQVRYKGTVIELPTDYANFLLQHNIVERV